MSSNSCSSKSGHCAFCGESLSNTPSPIPIAYGAPPEEGRGTFTKLKPLRWRFLTNKAPRTKYMCSACAEKRQVPQKTEQPVSLDSSWDGSQKHSEPALRLEHLESHDAVRQQRKSQRMQSEKREKLQERYPERRENRRSTREPLSSNSRRRGSSQTSEAQHDSARRSSVLQPFANHRKSRESIIRNRPASTVEIRTRTSVTNQRASVETLTRPRKSSTGQSEPRGSEKKDQRLSSTADILGMSRSLELPPNYFAMSSSSPTFSAPEHDSVDWRQIEMQLPPTEARKKNETEEERQRRRSASYAHMLVRMRRHYDTVQVNGTHGPPVTAPPRRIRAERRAKFVAVHSVKEDEPVKMDPADFAVDLDYLRAYKDAR
ncbi:hypothetical protein PC129_g11752 [Phytophthora cactorum]|uniref:Uncharacterized protein n=1 Tax=Phytophthora cactorum TaxID=29920 RepID=A0A329S4U5_9STRA|nr:hypothetical protein Pcac1_g3263 [Phytophthora cactorum]KAG2816028.1 hypothetical protein PC112_g13625 [Phytophthora cactorum]KAG2826219.1 hypothetical protein PC111_g9050 [Phytophthora cactorum]KAG2853743.1 hypothetical protein PC113_g13918 [Phytophthora cactorum]KAG2897488.1 hypothetical protein PC114_g14664 [Phytophthora cactorum]